MKKLMSLIVFSLALCSSTFSLRATNPHDEGDSYVQVLWGNISVGTKYKIETTDELWFVKGVEDYPYMEDKDLVWIEREDVSLTKHASKDILRISAYSRLRKK
ncbi:MAG: hypothetical protein Pg6B_08980 [Candidatus Azobacteroides pseudotrichonymphae]|nr:MAG: hypothetical protein Pg6B_08980 [Candidatus Azobacteroides pseudotrichonymphae]